MANGLFITIEGPDGAGKTTVLNELFPRLQMIAKKEIIKTREPGGVLIAEKIRQIILNPDHRQMDERTEALLYAAARRQHLVEVIMPALNEGKIVICDRFVDSSLTYQGAGRRIGMKEIAQINEFATEGLEPDFTLYLDVDSDTGLRRIQNHRKQDVDRLDLEGLEFHQRVRHAYLKLAEENPVRIHRIDAKMSLQEVVESSFSAIVESNPTFFKRGE
ncbi:dTMP kinase [Enterococcus cecorum]|uniref:Thymidylate kinase n=2 Tax=Enterococcus cecorum TaxID=44008 RepID=A0A1Y3UP42_9ENTE|nr:dTMP kinase [Enterococcus cecorum]KLO72024.1 thymidylate kinase [Enterococcus cecorum]MBM6936052.1 dTMP kinase [Enterococcus cecorum]MCJ0544310.1 dTMP kinase [Enterococcus cecorum]MCJ0547462.1 dTMP kinase [Enterococcus cecorum]MCJ0552196.1 dTMP kinase [Enterococcus cecorum]